MAIEIAIHDFGLEIVQGVNGITVRISTFGGTFVKIAYSFHILGFLDTHCTM